MKIRVNRIWWMESIVDGPLEDLQCDKRVSLRRFWLFHMMEVSGVPQTHHQTVSLVLQQPPQSQLPLDFSVTMVNIKLNSVNVSPSGGNNINNNDSSINNNNTNNNNSSMMIGKGGSMGQAPVTDENKSSPLNGVSISRPMSPNVLLTANSSNSSVNMNGSSNGTSMTSAFKVVTPRGKADGKSEIWNITRMEKGKRINGFNNFNVKISS